MKKTRWYSKEMRLKHVARFIRRLAKRHKIETNGFLLLSNAERHAKNGEIDQAIQDLGRFELAARRLSPSDRALIQSAKSELVFCKPSKLLTLLGSVVLSMVLKYGFTVMWGSNVCVALRHWIVSKTQISNLAAHVRASIHHDGVFGADAFALERRMQQTRARSAPTLQDFYAAEAVGRKEAY